MSEEKRQCDSKTCSKESCAAAAAPKEAVSPKKH